MHADPAGLLPLPLLAHGAVGRPGVDRLHRRHGHRRRARPQRPAPLALLGHRRRPGHHGVGGRACSTWTRPAWCARAGSSPGACSWSTRPGAHRRRRRDQDPPGRRASLRASGWTPGSSSSTTCPPRPAAAARHASVLHRQQIFGYTNEELRLLIAPDGPHRRRAASARWAPTRPSPCCPTGRGCCSTTSPSSSPRSPTRPSTPSARSWSRRWAAPIGPEGNLLAPGADSCRQILLPPPDHRQRRAGQAASTIDSRVDGFPARRPLTIAAACYDGRRGRRGAAPRHRRVCAAGAARPSRTGPTSSSCPTATPTPSWHRSRPCW